MSKPIKVNDYNHRRLWDIKLDMKHSSLDETIGYLLDNLNTNKEVE